jgi:hypothetical protein
VEREKIESILKKERPDLRNVEREAPAPGALGLLDANEDTGGPAAKDLIIDEHLGILGTQG